jgi:hypothetical protein
MKLLAFILLLGIVFEAAAQTVINKSYPVQPAQTIRFRFDYPELIKVSTWEKNEILVQGTVSINGGENDDAFALEGTTSGTVISIQSQIRNMKNLPHRYTVMKDGKKMVFKNKTEWRAYKSEYHDKHNWVSEGVDMDIVLEIKVPKNMTTTVESVYGMVEVKDFTGPLVVEATYGGVDASLTESRTGELTAETNYGQIYSNLNLKFSNSIEEDFHTVVSAKMGGGPNYTFESKYGNVYLRKLTK